MVIVMRIDNNYYYQFAVNIMSIDFRDYAINREVLFIFVGIV